MKRILMILLAVVLLFSLPVAAEEPLVSTLFFETDIREAINELVLQTGINIIPDDTVRGTVTLDLVDVPFERALRMMLIAGGFTYEKIEDFYLVGLPDPRSPIFQSLAQTETVQLNNLTSTEARELLPSFYDRYIRTTRDRDVITITAPSSIIERFKEDLAKIDQPRRQILIKAIITEVSTEVLREFGAGLFEFGLGEGQSVTPGWGAEIGYDQGTLTLQTDIYGDLLSRLRALEGDKKASIEANPRMIVGDRSTATLFVGETQFMLLQPTEGSPRFEKVDAGIQLKVTPRIMGDGAVQLTITPEVSHIDSQSRSLLTLRRSELSTTVYALNNQTLVLAGMTVSETVDSDRGLPFLGRIPILRWFFGQTVESQTDRELLIFITPEIL